MEVINRATCGGCSLDLVADPRNMPLYLPACLHTIHRKCTPCPIRQWNRNLDDFPDLRPQEYRVHRLAQKLSANCLFPKEFFVDVKSIECPNCRTKSFIHTLLDLPINHTLREMLNNRVALPEGTIKPKGVAVQMHNVDHYINRNIVTKMIYNSAWVLCKGYDIAVAPFVCIVMRILAYLERVFARIKSPLLLGVICGLATAFLCLSIIRIFGLTRKALISDIEKAIARVDNLNREIRKLYLTPQKPSSEVER